MVTLIHISADGSNDTLHYIWDFTGKPSILMALTPINTTVAINWNAYMSNELNSIKFSSKPKYSASFVLNRVS